MTVAENFVIIRALAFGTICSELLSLCHCCGLDILQKCCFSGPKWVPLWVPTFTFILDMLGWLVLSLSWMPMDYFWTVCCLLLLLC